MSHQIAEAALYGDLVKHLRDQWAEQAAQFNETSFADEQARIDRLIRQWFFSPQERWHGFTPRQIIRNEELDLPNVVPHEHLDEVFHDDCPICQAMREDALFGPGSEWHFSIAPDHSLLDEYDPKGNDAYWEEDARRSKERAAQRVEHEARKWLSSNPNRQAFAGNRFYDTQEALDFVNRLYELGAAHVQVENIYDEAWRIAECGGPYADTFVVELPESPEASVDIFQVFLHELGERQGLELTRYIEFNTLYFWWD